MFKNCFKKKIKKKRNQNHTHPAPQIQQNIYFGDWNTNPQYQTYTRTALWGLICTKIRGKKKCICVLEEVGKTGTSRRLPHFLDPTPKSQKSTKNKPYRLPGKILNFRKWASNRKNAPQNAHQKSRNPCSNVYVIYFMRFQKWL